MRKVLCVVAVALVASGLTLGGQQPPAQVVPVPQGQATAAPPAEATNLGSDANGNPLRRALKTGHVSNYDEAKVSPFTLPDPLVLANGTPVRDPQTWIEQRRPEILRIYETEIYGRVPAKTPAVTWQVAETDTKARDGTAVMKKITGSIGGAPDAQQIKLTLLHPGRRHETCARHPAGQLWRRPAAATGRAGEGRRRVPIGPAGCRRHHQPWVGLRHRRVSGYPAGSARHVHPGGHRRDARAGANGAGARRVGDDQRVVVGHQPDHRLSRDRPFRERQADRALRPLAPGEDRVVGVGEGRADSGDVLELLRRDGRGAGAARLGRDRRRHGAELPLAVRRQLAEVGSAAGTRCPSTRTC